jgi:hypothetical protein
MGIEKAATTYIVVTARKWQTKSKWCDEKNKVGVWKDVRVYDSATLEEWLEMAPAVDVWLAGLMHLKPNGVSDLDDYWLNVQALTESSLKPDVFIASREKQVEALKEWLAGPPGAVVIKTRSPAEAVDFVAAVVRQLPDSETVIARAVIVESKEAWQAICRSDAELILIAHPDLAVEPEMVAEAVRRGHRAILPTSRELASRAFILELNRVYRHDLEKALESSGFGHAEARDIAKRAGGSLTVLKRTLAKMQGTKGPAWAVGSEASSLIPMLLMGAWENDVEGDRKALESMAGQPYDEVLSTAERWRNSVDAPISEILSRWSILSRDDSWFLLSHAVTPNHLRRFEKIAVEVLGEYDPSLELPIEDRWLSNIKNKQRTHSHTIRTGIAESLALMSGRSELLAISQEVVGLVASVVRRLLNDKPWQTWAALSPQLSLLAEAVPDEFLAAVEHDLEKTESELMKLFSQESQTLFSSPAYLANFLWALEGLAWEKGLLPRVCYILARLDERIAENSRGNRPRNSLITIFMPWFPQTTAPVEERIKILSAMVARHPKAGWRILIGLLPVNSHTSPIHRPVFRDWALSWKEGTTNYEYHQQILANSELLVELASNDLERWKSLIERLENLAPQVGRKFIVKLLEADTQAFDTLFRREVAESLREKVRMHRTYSDAKWALPESVVRQLEEAKIRFEPSDVISRNLQFFDNRTSELEYLDESKAKKIPESRRKAIQDIESEIGWDGILSFAKIVDTPFNVGFYVAESDEDMRILPSLLNDSEPKINAFARGYIWGRYKSLGWDWINQLQFAMWSPQEMATLALEVGFEPKTWEFVNQHGKHVDEAYWSRIRRNDFPLDASVVRFAVGKLLEYGRPFQAAFLIEMARHRGLLVNQGLIIEVLEKGMTIPVENFAKQATEHTSHYLLDLLTWLQNVVGKRGSELEHLRIAKIEWGYLGLLNGHPASPVILHRLLSKRPEFFNQLLGMIFRSDNDDKIEELSLEDQSRAQSAYRLLMDWHDVPGTREDGSIDEQQLIAWIREVRSTAQDQGRLPICDERIGEVFAFAPKESTDEGWPCIPVRDAIEEIGTQELTNGFEIGIFNKRGTYSKAFDAGGEQERSIAKRYHDWAEIAKFKWPKTATALRQMANKYERDAYREDANKELRLI